MKIYPFFILSTILFILSCRNFDHYNHGLIYHVDLEKDINSISSVPLSNLGSKLEYVTLETNPACMIQEISDVSVSDSFLFVRDRYRLFLFNRRGKFIKLIGSQGRGPGEYNIIWDFAVDGTSKEVYVLASGRKILVYDFDGKFVRDLMLGFPCTQFVLNERNELVFHPVNLSRKTNEPVYSLHILNKNGRTITRIPNTLRRVNGGIAIPISPLYVYNEALIFMEFGIDTSYIYDNNKKRPYSIFYYGNLKFPPDPAVDEILRIDERLCGKFYVNNILETDKTLLLDICYLLPHVSISNCYYDKSTSRLTVLKDDGFVNDIDGGMIFWPEEISNDGLMIDYVDAFELIKSYKQQANSEIKSAQLVNVVKNLTETSNPVIMILYP